MKKIFISAWLLALATVSFGQQNSSPKYDFKQEDYLTKSKKQKTFAWVLVGGGAALAVVGLAIPKGEKDGFDILTWSDTYKNEDIKASFILGGALSMGGSIPLFIASGRNKRKALAASAFVDFEKVSLLNQSQITNQRFAVTGIRIRL